MPTAWFALILSRLLPRVRLSRFTLSPSNHIHPARAPSSRSNPRLPLAFPRLPRILLRLRPSPRPVRAGLPPRS